MKSWMVLASLEINQYSLLEDQAKAVLRVCFSFAIAITPDPSPQPQRRRPLLPPLRRVESDGVGVTSSILPIFIPERAKARSADWAPGPGVFVPLPRSELD